MKLVRINYTDLFAKVDDNTYARLQKVRAVYDPSEPYSEAEFEAEHRARHLAIIKGEVYLVHPETGDEVALKRWVLNPAKGTIVTYRHGDRFDLSGEMLVTMTRREYNAHVRSLVFRPTPQIASPEVAWIPELRAYVPAFYLKKAKGNKAMWQVCRDLPAYSAEALVIENALARKVAKKAEVGAAQRQVMKHKRDSWIQDARESLKAKADEFVPIGEWLSPKGQAWGGDRDAQSAFVVAFGLQVRSVLTNKPSVIAEASVLELLAGLKPQALARALDLLEQGGLIESERRKDDILTKGPTGQYQKNLSRRCRFLKGPEPEEAIGLFPVRVATNPLFEKLSVRNRAVLVALYLMAGGRPVVDFLIDDLMSHSGLKDRDAAKAALSFLHEHGFLSSYINPCINRHFPYDRTFLHVEFSTER